MSLDLFTHFICFVLGALAGEPNCEGLGRRIVLPATFTGSPRQMNQFHHNAIAIVQKEGKPSLFVTMTCNPRWPEIENALLPGQRSHDRPDLVVRVFHLKLNALLDDMTKHSIFGRVVGYVYTVEFQKRGLPHAHILKILNPLDRVGDPEAVDSVVSAEIPDKDLYPDLYETIMRCNVHGPCGALNPNSSCMKDGVCSKNFPKESQEETVFAHDSYPLYKRYVCLLMFNEMVIFCSCDGC